VAFGMIEVLLIIVWGMIKVELARKAEQTSLEEHHRRLGVNDKDIGTLYSKLHDSEMNREKMHRDIVETINANHLVLMNVIQAVLSGPKRDP